MESRDSSEFGQPNKVLKIGDHPLIDLKIKFRNELEKSGIKGLYVANGSVMETFINFNKDFGYWGDENLKISLTSYDDIAKFTIDIVSDPNITGHVNVRGDFLTVTEMAPIYSKVTGKDIKARRNGSLEDMKNLIDTLNKEGKIGEAIRLGFFYLLFQERFLFEKADNSKFKNFVPRSWEQFVKDTQL